MNSNLNRRGRGKTEKSGKRTEEKQSKKYPSIMYIEQLEEENRLKESRMKEELELRKNVY